MKNLLPLAILCASIISPLAAHADPIVSTIGFDLHSVTVDGSKTGSFSPADGITTISWNNKKVEIAGDGTGVFTGLVTDADSVFQSTSGTLDVQSANGGVDGSHPFTFTVIGDDGLALGTFTDTVMPVVAFSNGTNGSALTLELFGTFVFKGALASDAPQSSELKFDFTQPVAGGTDQGSGTLETPRQDVIAPTGSVPEPSGLALLGTGILSTVGIVAFRFRT